METLPALVGFSLVSSVTPGPNNVLLWASGAVFGFRATIQHVLGTAVGIGLLALVAAAGVGTLLSAAPGIAVVMKVGASAYLLYLAYRIAGAHALERGEIAHPLGVLQAIVFQAANPKAWVFALGAVTAYRPTDAPALVGTLLVALTMTVVVVPTAALWAGAGGAIGRLMTGRRTRRAISLALSLLLAATVAYVWL